MFPFVPNLHVIATLREREMKWTSSRNTLPPPSFMVSSTTKSKSCIQMVLFCQQANHHKPVYYCLAHLPLVCPESRTEMKFWKCRLKPLQLFICKKIFWNICLNNICTAEEHCYRGCLCNLHSRLSATQFLLLCHNMTDIIKLNSLYKESCLISIWHSQIITKI